MSVDPYRLMNDGHTIPVTGFGTYAPEKFPKSLAEEATKLAIEVGYRHIDSAGIYGNEVEVGRAIRRKIEDGTVKREEIFYTGKLWGTHHNPELVRPALEKSLRDLQLDYMDLFIIHTPLAFEPRDNLFSLNNNYQNIYVNVDIRDTWEALEQCKDAGLVKSIGVSNFNRRQLELILNKPGLKHKPVCNQVECHLYLNQSKLLEYCRSQNILLVGYSTLGSSRDGAWIDQSAPILLEDPVLNEIAKKHNRTAAQVALRFLLQRGIVVLAKSFNPVRIKQNFQVLDFQLPEEDMNVLVGLNKDLRYDTMEVWKDHPDYPYHDEYPPLTMSSPNAYVVLNDGNKMPVIGFGTYAPQKFPKSLAEEGTKVAIETGYRHIDCAFIYGNEVEVGRAIRAKIADGTVKREEIFYTGKLWSTFHAPELVRPVLEKSLKALELDYMDLFIIHSPVEFKPGDDLFPVDENGKLIYNNTDIRDTWKALEACKDAGLVKSIGVSNFNRRQLELILNMPGLKHKPVCNQVECHIYLNQSKMLEFCKANDIALVAYSVLGSSRDENWIDQNSPVLLEDPVLIRIAEKLHRTPAQVAMRYMLQRGIVVLAKSYTPARIKQNFQVFDFELSPEDMKTLNGLNKNMRYVRISNHGAKKGSEFTLSTDGRIEGYCTEQKKSSKLRPPPLTMSSPNAYVVLNDGNKMPVVGFGTYAPQKSPKILAEEGTKVAIETGYRHIDCAFLYGNEVEVGRGIRAKIANGTVKREEIFYTGKLWSTFHTPELVRPALEKSLKDLGLDYMDLFIIHSPIEFKPGNDPLPLDENGKVIYHNTDIRDTWKALEACKDAGLVKSIGVSNFNRRQLELILNMPGLKHKPVCNQVECHIYLNQSKLLEFCKAHDIVLVAYFVLGSCREGDWFDQNSPVLLKDPVLNTIAEKLHRTPAQVAMRYMLQRGIVVLAKSFTPERIKQNFQVFDFELSPEDMKTLDGLNKNMRFIILKDLEDHPKFPYNDEY
ncbi:uncharacterized protein LOC128490298 [Spea bombifrons]|uniref:uncharacterized protein LOC128490298 n=1 Tax=Spea bombifrons TaxID=233779 RepID=UPI002349C9B9|nr:uncharacterized protein LOC128490298 [Spea bombifrons]